MSSRPAYTSGSIDLVNTIGATYLGVIFSTFVAGICFNQAFQYFRNFKTDIGLFRGAVICVSVLNLAHAGCIIASQYYWTVTGWGDAEKLDDSTVEYPVSFLLTGLIAAVVQTCYAYRIYIVSKRQLYIPACIVLLTLAQLGASWYATIKAAQAGKQSLFVPYFKAAYVWLYGEAVADFIITATLIYYLQSVREMTTFGSTRQLATKLAILTFETNALTLVSCVTAGVLLQVRKDGWGPGVNYMSARLYSLSLLVTLNARAHLTSSGSGNTMSQGTISRFGHELSKYKEQGDLANQVHVAKDTVSVAYPRGDNEKRPNPFADEQHPYAVAPADGTV